MHITVECRSLTPLLMDKFAFGRKVLPALDSAGTLTQEELRVFADQCRYLDANSNLCIPSKNVNRGLIDASTFSKGTGKSTLQKNVSAGVQLNWIDTPLLDPNSKQPLKDYTIAQLDKGVNPNTKGVCPIVRPLIQDWLAVFPIEFNGDLLTEKQMMEVITNLGVRVGIMCWSPKHKGPHELFSVKKVS